MKRYYAVLLLSLLAFIYPVSSISAYSGSQAYNYSQHLHASVNIATGTFHFSYPLIHTSGIHHPFTVKLTYRFNASGAFGLPKGWQLDLDHINNNVVNMGGQWLIDPLWHDETLFASGLKYFNQHGTRFVDNTVEQPIPNEDTLFYRYRSQHKDGVVKYFSHAGLLILQKDRFGNRITFAYQEGAKNIEEARLAAITDNYGNRYTFSYEPGVMVVHYPDARVQKIFFSPTGVVTIINPMQQRYEFKFINYSGYNLIETINPPTGLVTQLSYSTIPFKSRGGEGVMPVVSEFKQFDSVDNKIHHESHYSYSSESNYTGYPLYAMSDSADSLMESNNENYHYYVTVEQVDSNTDVPTVHKKVYRYNYLHLPRDIRTFKAQKEFLKTEYTYNISPFKYSRSTNYDKPNSTVHLLWSEQQQQHIPTNRIDHQYDLFGNKTHESHWVYHRPKQQWRQYKATAHQYFTSSYSLLMSTVHHDLISGKAIKSVYHLSPSRKTHSTKQTFGRQDQHVKLWHPWQQESYCYDDAGRVIKTQRKWLAQGMPGVQQTHKKTHYHFDKHSAILTVQHESSLGHVSQKLTDTRNRHVIAHISPMGEKTKFHYNNIGQLTAKTDPEGHVHTIRHYTFAQDGFNAKVMESPLGFKIRHKMNAAEKTTVIEEWLHGQYHTIAQKEYDAFGKVVANINRFGQVTRYQYDDLLRLTAKTDPWRNKTQFVYDDENLITQTLFNGKKHNQTQKTPWLLSETKTHYPLNNTSHTAVQTTTQKNGFGKVVVKESALLDLPSQQKHSVVTSRYEYDTGHNKTAIETRSFDGLTLAKHITYDLFRNRYKAIKKQNNNGQISTHYGYDYVYNTDNRLTRVISPNIDHHGTLVTEHHRNSNGQEIERVNPDGSRVHYQYTPRGQLQSARWNRNHKAFQVHYRYDPDKHLIKASDSDGYEQHFQYDLRGNLTRLIFPDQRQQSYTYDNSRRLVRQENVGNRVLTYHYDKKDKGKLSAIKSDNHLFRFTYGEDNNGKNGQILSIERQINGTEPTKETYTYGPYGRVARSTVTKGHAASDYLSREYDYQPRGDLTKQTTHSASATEAITYHYDGVNRLIKETHHKKEHQNQHTRHEISYQYDGNNNIIKEQRTRAPDATQTLDYHYNAADQLTHIKQSNPGKALQITYDKNGHLLTDHLGQQYNYDDQGLLLSVNDANGQALASFHYLPNGFLGHLHHKNSRQSFYYHKNSRVQTVLKNQKLYDYVQYGHKFIGNLSKEGGDHLFISNQSTGARLGVSAQGTNANLYSYEGYGKTTHPAQDDSSTDFLWNQELSDQATGLVYLRHRFYHPQLKRFIKRDDQRNDNRYAYAVANPIAFIDPMGRSATGDTVLKSLNYVAGIGTVILSMIGVALAIPTGGASLSLTAAGGMAGGSLGSVSGASLIAAQSAIDTGHKAAGNGLRLSGFVIGSLSFLLALPMLVTALAPETAATIAKAATSSSGAGESVTRTIAGSMSGVEPEVAPPGYESVMAGSVRSTEQTDSALSEHTSDLSTANSSARAAHQSITDASHTGEPPPSYSSVVRETREPEPVAEAPDQDPSNSIIRTRHQEPPAHQEVSTPTPESGELGSPDSSTDGLSQELHNYLTNLGRECERALTQGVVGDYLSSFMN